MSLNLTSVITLISDVSPVIFAVATAAGVAGSLVSRLLFKRATAEKSLAMEIDQLILEINRKAGTYSPEEVRRLHRQVIEQLVVAQQREAPPSIFLSKLGEYLSNHSPSDSLTRGFDL